MSNEFSSRKNMSSTKKSRRAGLRADRIAAAYNAAEERNAAYQKLSTKEKLAKLDLILGSGQGAQRQRARLNALLEAKVPAAEPVEKSMVTEKKTKKSK